MRWTTMAPLSEWPPTADLGEAGQDYAQFVIVDLSHEIVAGMVTYPGIAAPQLHITVSREESAERLDSGAAFEIGSLTLAGNTGTYIDSPYHYHADRAFMNSSMRSGWMSRPGSE